jgi:hypothetical protein
MTDHGRGEIDHALGHAAMGEEITGENEERDRHDFEALDPGEQFERDRLDRHRRHHVQESEHRETERDRDRHAGQHQRDQQDEDEGRGHRAISFATAGLSITPST